MKNGDNEAFPVSTNEYAPGWGGLTKREYFAAIAMQGMLATITCSRWEDRVIAGVVEASVTYADALLDELEKTHDRKNT